MAMQINDAAGLWARTALVWFVLTMAFGMYLGLTQQFHMSSPHAHMGLLGWLSSGLFALLYALAGDAPGSRWPPLHWAAHNLGVAAMATGLFLTIRNGPSWWTAMIPLGGLVLILATLWLAAMLWPRLRAR